MNLPDRTRPPLTLPIRSVAGRVARIASAAVWRSLHPAARESFLEAPAPPTARRLHYQSSDGWQAPIFRMDPPTRGTGDAVLLIHGLVAGTEMFRYGSDGLAGALRNAGFTVYLLTHRGDRVATPPAGTHRRSITVDEIIERDLPAALEAISTDTQRPKVHVIGHGLGGLLAYGLAAFRHPALASVVALGAPLVFPRPTTEARIASSVLSLLPAQWHLPLRTVGRAGVPFAADWAPLDHLASSTPAPRVRGACAYGLDDPPIALVSTLRSWVLHGKPTLLGGAVDLEDRLCEAEVPLLAITAEEDPWCGPASGERAVARWGHADSSCAVAPGAHFDLLLGCEANETVFTPIARWLARREPAWRAAG